MNRPGAEDMIYVAAVLTLYADLPDTPLRPSPMDQSVARKLHQEAVPLLLVESALLLATLRRRARSLGCSRGQALSAARRRRFRERFPTSRSI